jgi:hypothetical protein
MDPAKAQFLFGEAAGTVDPDDPDAWADLLEVDPDEPLAETRTTVRQLVAQQIVGDDPPEVWATARRIVGAEREPAQAMHQLSMALMHALEESLSGDGSSFERSFYVELLERLPLPRAAEVEEAVVAEARARHPIESEELERLALERLGRNGDPLTERMVEHMVDRLGDVDVLAWLPGDEIVHVGELTRGIVLTHRLTAIEREQDLLWADFDLAGFMTHGHLSLPGGGELEMVELEDGGLGWEGPEGWLTPFAEGSLLAVRIGEQGVLEIEELAAAPAAEDGLAGRLQAVYLREVEEPWLPVRAADLVLGLLAEDRSSFDRPQPPLDTLCEAVGLERRGRSVAHDASVWANSVRLGRLSRVMDRLPDREGRSSAMFVFNVADKPDPTAEDLLHALDALREPLVARAVADELLPSDLSPEALKEAQAFAERLVAQAKGSRRAGAAQWLAAVAAERAGDVLAADNLLSLALRADPMWEPVVERAAWYASDRGDAAAALELWGRLAEPNLRDVETVGPFAPAPGHRLGRNDPCWCGSGRKFKVCHLDKPAVAPLSDRVGWLCRKATAFLEHHEGAAAEQVVANAFARAVDPEDDESVLEAFEDPIVIDAALTEGGWFDRFVTERGPLLPDDEALLARSWTLVDVRPGSGLTVRDLRTGARLAIRERRFSLQAQPQDVVCGRAVPDGDTNQFVGSLFPVAPGTEAHILNLCDKADPEELCAHVATLYRPSRLQTREGTPIVALLQDGG